MKITVEAYKTKNPKALLMQLLEQGESHLRVMMIKEAVIRKISLTKGAEQKQYMNGLKAVEMFLGR